MYLTGPRLENSNSAQKIAMIVTICVTVSRWLLQQSGTVREHFKQHRININVISVFQHHNEGSPRNFQKSTEVLTQLLNLSLQTITANYLKKHILNELPIPSNMEHVTQAEHSKKAN